MGIAYISAFLMQGKRFYRVVAAVAAGIPVICIPDLKEPASEVLNLAAAVVRRK